MRTRLLACYLVVGFATQSVVAQTDKLPKMVVKDHYVKKEVKIPMRDGVNLFTQVYSPKDTTKQYPILMVRTPYSIAPYGEDAYRDSVGPSDGMERAGYFFVYQDVRGQQHSEGKFLHMRPAIASDAKKDAIDESTDTYDTVEWLIKNLPNNNGKVGQWGISYPGFYSSAGMINAHPALKAVSPQAPIADWFFDDFYHHGAFFLPHAYNFFCAFNGGAKSADGQNRVLAHSYADGYKFFLDQASLKNLTASQFTDTTNYWHTLAEHVTYDEYWKERNLLPHLKKVAPAVMTVGGWYDAEDLYGPLKTYRSIETKNPGIFNMIVMGPWRHGGWHRSDGDSLGNMHFGSKTSRFYQENIETVFFEHFLRGQGENKLPEAYVFETGRNKWRTFDAWPPKGTVKKELSLNLGGALSFEPTVESTDSFSEYVSDPAKPVPYSEVHSTRFTQEYMTDDQSFASRRPDVLAFQTKILENDVSLVGPLKAEFWVSTSGTDSDWVVKLIDVFPNDAKAPEGFNPTRPWGGYEMMVRSEILRGKFRNSYEKPEAFVPNEPVKISLELLDVCHTFQKGHRIMVQVQSSWFPMVDRNPQKFVPNVFQAADSDFVKATQRVYHSTAKPSKLSCEVLDLKP